MVETSPRNGDTISFFSVQNMIDAIENIYFVYMIAGFICLTSILPITKLSVGISYFHQCPTQPQLLIWLIVSGCRGLFCIILIFSIVGIVIATDRHCKKPISNLMILSGLLIVAISAFSNFGWSIVGIFWTLSIKSTVQHKDSTNTSTYCHSTPYVFVILMAFFQTIIIITFLIVGCFYGRRESHRPTNTSNNQAINELHKQYRNYIIIFFLSLVFFI
ncbi:unnamed protein product [Adineta steineri]|uniref:Uncharacterized protein n=1 Tax=Adineta steineri TaxID=433720 RepID=A0A814LS31_9BILA|nr:unnamed protein product [Adineta steineri]